MRRTAFYDLHREKKGKLVEFAGYELPVQFEGEHGGVLKEHLHTRSEGGASLFDVAHMGQLRWFGKDRVKFIEKLVVSDIASLKEGEGRLSLITNERGGIIDDTVITNAGDYLYMVVNGATKWTDLEHFKKHLSDFNGDVTVEHMEDQQLLALQGPAAATVMGRLSSLDIKKMSFMNSVVTEIKGMPVRVSRCGYTGEDGFEISMRQQDAVNFARLLLEQPEVHPAGLGARDSLRLEAGLCLYGHDINEDTNPVEAALAWTLGGPKGRRRLEQGFIGASAFLTPEGKLKPVTRKRVGLTGMRSPAREHTEIFTADGSRQIGVVTSGTFSPCLKAPIAMGYIEKDIAVEGTEVAVKVRGNLQPATVSKMPFIEHKYFKASA